MILPGAVIRQGDSLKVSIGLTGVSDLTGWSCKVIIGTGVDDPSPLLAINVTQLSDDNSRFILFVSRGTTPSWPPGDYLIMADVWNTGTGEGSEVHGELRVEAQGVA